MPDPARQELDRLMQCLPHGLRPAEAGGWSTRLHLQVDGISDHTVVIDEGAIQVEGGLSGEATATVQVDARTLIDVLRGDLGAQAAFGEGRLLIDSFGDLIRFSRAFDFAAVAAAAALPAGERPSPAAQAAALPTGKRYSAGHMVVTPDINASSICCGQMKWMCASMQPAVTIIPSPAMISVPAPMAMVTPG